MSMEKKTWKRKRPLLTATVAQESVETISILSEVLSLPRGIVLDKAFAMLLEKYTIEDIVEYMHIDKT